MQLVSMSEHFGWTPEQVRAIDTSDKMIYVSVLKGASEAQPKK